MNLYGQSQVNGCFTAQVVLRLTIYPKYGLPMEKAIPCKRIGVAVIGLEVPHAHIHLIPLQNVSDINFSRPKLSFPKEEMEETAKAIRKYWE